MSGGGGATITLLKGDDASVLRDAVRTLVDELVGDDDRALVVEEVEVGASGGDDDGRDPLVALVDAAQTPPFLTDTRVVIGRVSEKRERMKSESGRAFPEQLRLTASTRPSLCCAFDRTSDPP